MALKQPGQPQSKNAGLCCGYFCKLFRTQPAVFIEIVVARATQSATDHLLTKQLRHKRPQADNVRHRAAIPPLRPTSRPSTRFISAVSLST